jgi:formamidopyrimidine-DNA glycosylase
MPELPEVETVRRGLEAKLTGGVVARVQRRRADLRAPLPRNLKHRLEGRRLERIDRRGKYLLFHFDTPTVLIVHLGMSGRFVLTAPPAPPPALHDHVIIEWRRGPVLTFNDVRRFGLMTLTRAHDLAAHPLLRGLGPEPLDSGFDGPALGAALRGRRTAIKAALLDQRVVAGIGNIYACEALFRARISPRRIADSVRGERAARLAAAIRTVLEAAIAAGGSSLRDYVQASGELGYFQHAFAVYGREGEVCPGCDCGGAVRRIVQGGRSTFYCPRVQR